MTPTNISMNSTPTQPSALEKQSLSGSYFALTSRLSPNTLEDMLSELGKHAE